MQGIIQHLFIKPGRGQPMVPQDQLRMRANAGIAGDHNAGRKRRQVLLIEMETLREFGLKPGQLRENIVVSGVVLAGLPAGTILHAGSARLEVTMDCDPCAFVDTLGEGFFKRLDGRRGTLARVLGSGDVQCGDTLTA
jgi:MOSC domain-containing protein YiiM